MHGGTLYIKLYMKKKVALSRLKAHLHRSSTWRLDVQESFDSAGANAEEVKNF